MTVELDDIRIRCTPDGTWHYTVKDAATGLAGEWTHTGNGYPMWYGKGSPQVFSPHSISYGYIWAGKVEGRLTVDGRDIAIHGAGQRERYYSVDACPAEVGAWHDWMWFHFDEMSGNLDEMKISKHKDMSLFLVDEQNYIAAGDFQIEHHDWAYDPRSGAFIPTRYHVTIETTVGVLDLHATALGAYPASGVGEAPDSPTILLDWGPVEGTFAYEDGRTRTLTNGLGGTLIRQWKPYPNVLVSGGDFQPLTVPRV